MDYFGSIAPNEAGTVPASLRIIQKRSAAAVQTLQTMPPTKNTHLYEVLWFLRKTIKPQQIKHELKNYIKLLYSFSNYETKK